MKFSAAEAAILVHALAAYRVLAGRGDLPAPTGGTDAIDALQRKLDRAMAGEPPGDDYRGIGERKRSCFCRTCRTILEGQLRDVLTRLPDDQRRDVVDRVEGSIAAEVR